MSTFLFVFVFLLFIISIMSIGVIFRNKPIKGSCGGIGQCIDGEKTRSEEPKSSCPICGKS